MSFTKLAVFPSEMEDLFEAEEFETAIARSPGDVGRQSEAGPHDGGLCGTARVVDLAAAAATSS